MSETFATIASGGVRRPSTMRYDRTLSVTEFQVPPPEQRPWWGQVMDEERFTDLVREIEVAKGRLSAHERECAVRYQALNTTVDQIKNDVSKLVDRVQGNATGDMRKVLAVAGTVITLLLGLLAWMGGQLYALEPTRVQAVQAGR